MQPTLIWFFVSFEFLFIYLIVGDSRHPERGVPVKEVVGRDTGGVVEFKRNECKFIVE